jgi:hypothetical protein
MRRPPMDRQTFVIGRLLQPAIRPPEAAGGEETLKSSFSKFGDAASRATTMLSATQLTTASSEVRRMLFMGDNCERDGLRIMTIRIDFWKCFCMPDAGVLE